MINDNEHVAKEKKKERKSSDAGAHRLKEKLKVLQVFVF